MRSSQTSPSSPVLLESAGCLSKCLGPEDGLPAPCAANLDAVLTIDKRHVEQRIARLSQEKMKAIEEALRFALDLSI